MKSLGINKLFAFSLVVGAATTSCDIIKDIEYTATPDPLEVHGDTVVLKKIDVTFEAKDLHKKAVAEVTPILVCSDGKEFPFRMDVYQGEKAPGNGIVIPADGKKVQYKTSSIAYHPSMENAELKVRVLASKGKKKLDPYLSDKIADATIITPFLVQADDKTILAKDEFVRVTSHTTEATINYQKAKFNVRASELKEQDIKEFEAFVAEAISNERLNLKGLNIMAYASPEGEIEKNTNLAADRAGSAQKYLEKMFKKAGFNVEEGFITLSPKGEDWNGFKAEVQKTNHEDKDLILRVLQMTSDLDKREQEIKNMAATYTFLEESVLPQLRRSQMTLSFEEIGYSDEELKQMSKSAAGELTVEELLYAATLFDGLDDKLQIYKSAEKMFPNDWRGINNVGHVLYLSGNVDGARDKFNKANDMNSNPITKNNLGAVERMKGNSTKAWNLYSEAAGVGEELNYNKGIIDIERGRYSDAISNMNGFSTFNLALAKLLSGDAEGCLSAVDASDDKESAVGYYLKAIAGARMSNKEVMVNNLKSACGKDAEFKNKVAKDREFIKYFEDVDFKSAIQ